MGQYRRHVFVCTSGSTCPTQGDTEAFVKYLRAEDLPEIVQSHLLGGAPVERLVYRPGRPGPNVLAKAKP